MFGSLVVYGQRNRFDGVAFRDSDTERLRLMEAVLHPMRSCLFDEIGLMFINALQEVQPVEGNQLVVQLYGHRHLA